MASELMCFKNSVWMLSFPGAFPFLRDFIATSNSSTDRDSERWLNLVNVLVSSLISALT